MDHAQTHFAHYNIWALIMQHFGPVIVIMRLIQAQNVHKGTYGL